MNLRVHNVLYCRLSGFGIRVRGRCFVKWGRLSKNHGSTYFGYKPGNNINAPVPLLLHISLQESNAAGFPLIVNQPPLMLHTNKRHYSQSHSQPDVWIWKLYQLYENIRMGWCYNSLYCALWNKDSHVKEIWSLVNPDFSIISYLKCNPINKFIRLLPLAN